MRRGQAQTSRTQQPLVKAPASPPPPITSPPEPPEPPSPPAPGPGEEAMGSRWACERRETASKTGQPQQPGGIPASPPPPITSPPGPPAPPPPPEPEDSAHEGSMAVMAVVTPTRGLLSSQLLTGQPCSWCTQAASTHQHRRHCHSRRRRALQSHPCRQSLAQPRKKMQSVWWWWRQAHARSWSNASLNQPPPGAPESTPASPPPPITSPPEPPEPPSPPEPEKQRMSSSVTSVAAPRRMCSHRTAC